MDYCHNQTDPLPGDAALQAAIAGMPRALKTLPDEGSIGEAAGLLASFTERQRLVGKPGFDAMEKKYAA